mmetsp:Transcript_26459/g.88155  ORF Transcript_26459/g.88155 Transcript_26459/m.88155 type:complete len:335 (+) Transcript_26459:457-1461(+)
MRRGSMPPLPAAPPLPRKRRLPEDRRRRAARVPARAEAARGARPHAGEGGAAAAVDADERGLRVAARGATVGGPQPAHHLLPVVRRFAARLPRARGAASADARPPRDDARGGAEQSGRAANLLAPAAHPPLGDARGGAAADERDADAGEVCLATAGRSCRSSAACGGVRRVRFCGSGVGGGWRYAAREAICVLRRTGSCFVMCGEGCHPRSGAPILAPRGPAALCPLRVCFLRSKRRMKKWALAACRLRRHTTSASGSWMREKREDIDRGQETTIDVTRAQTCGRGFGPARSARGLCARAAGRSSGQCACPWRATSRSLPAHRFVRSRPSPGPT